MIKPVMEEESFCKLNTVIKSQSVVECRFPQSSEIVEIVAVCPQVSLTSCEVSSGRVNYGGRLVLSIVYSDEEGKLCRMQKGAEFTHFADDDSLAPAQTGICRLACEKTQVKRDGSSFVVSVIVGASIDVYSRCQRSFITSCEGVQVKTENKKLYSAITFSASAEIEDEFDADSLVDVLIPGAQPLVLSSKCGTGEIEVCGEIYLSLFAMRQDTPVSLDRVIPFKTVIPCDDSSIGKTAGICAEIKDLNVVASINEERGKCEISFVCDLGLTGVFYDDKEVDVAVDAFACDRAVELAYNKEECAPCIDVKAYSERVSGLAASKSKLDYTCQLKAAALPRVEYTFVKESGAVEGSVCAVLVYEQNEELKSTEINLPFAVPLSGISDKQNVSLSVAVCGMSVKQRSEGEIEAEAVLKIGAEIYGGECCEYLTKIDEGEAFKASDSAITVFIPDAGDGLWEISKKLKRPPQDVADCNPELVFPLTGKERILVYRTKAV